MALFGKKQKEKKDASTEAQNTEVQKGTAAPVHARAHVGSDIASVLKSPRITEKAAMHQGAGVYTFEVANNATKQTIAQAVAAAYKVVPKKVRIVSIPSKRKRSARSGIQGMTQGGKKAYVYLAKGETIAIG